MGKPRVAAIDLGTNTALLLIAERSDGRLVVLDEDYAIVRLGEGIDRTGILGDAAVERTLAALHQFSDRIGRWSVDRVGAVGTQALREARNGATFRAHVEAILGAPIEVIDGAREATLSWSAAASSFPIYPAARRTVVDIGGGSTEIIVGGETIERLASVPIGSVRLTERLLLHDPPIDSERQSLVDTIDRALDQAPAPEGELIGIAGTVTTLAAMALGLSDYDGARVHGHRLSRSEILRLADHLGSSTIADRRRTPGLDPRRADVIYAGAMILGRLLERTTTDSVLVSDRGIRWGLAEELASVEQ